MNLPTYSKIDNMKKLIILFFPLFLSACFAGEEFYDCGGTGLVISGKKATLGAHKYELCKKKGVELFFAEKCNKGNSGIFGTEGFYFDSITGKISASFVPPNANGQCIKIK